MSHKKNLNIQQNNNFIENSKKVVKLVLILVIFYSIFAFISNLKSDNSQDITTQSYVSNQRLEAIKQLAQLKENDHVLGNLYANINIILYSNYQCQYSQEVYQRLKQMLNEYQDEITVVVRHLPDSNFNSASSQKARFIDCLSQINGPQTFWGYHEQLFSVNELKDIKLNDTKLNQKIQTCLNHSQDQHSAYFQYLDQAEIKSTPVMIISSSTDIDLLIGNQSLSNLRRAIEKQL